jgi:transposase
MANRRFQLKEDQIRELVNAHHCCKDGPTRTRLLAVRLYGTNYAAQEVRKITGCSQTSLLRWCQKYRQQGVSGLEDHRQGGNRALLTPEQIQELRARLHTYTPGALLGPQAATLDGQFWTVEDLQQVVQQWYGVRYKSPTSYRQLLTLCGFSRQRPARVYKSRRESDDIAFEELLEKN